jgi:hypothetical protein
MNSKKMIHDAKPKLIYDVWGLFSQQDFPDSRYLKFGQSIKN